MSTYRKADADCKRLLASVIREHHSRLTDAGVTVECLFAFGPVNQTTGERTGPALKHANWPAAALVKINSLKDRVAGLADCRITVDGDQWPEWSEEERLAILDHEAEHVEVRYDDEGAVLLDDANRPKLKLRPHDWQCAGFDSIIDRHGTAALEAKQAIDLNRRLTQKEFQWG